VPKRIHFNISRPRRCDCARHFSKDPGASSNDELNSLWIIIAAIIGIIALIAWLAIRKIKKDYDSKKEPKIRA
jgi:hypothetical protein